MSSLLLHSLMYPVVPLWNRANEIDNPYHTNTIRCHTHTHTPVYPPLDFQSLRSFNHGALGIMVPDLLDTRTFSPSSVYMYFTRQGLLETDEM